ncbi:hypothetical protein EYF80_050415 [Liparis tanakae]|uniref:Uncharacterized protein n=1 Tax=Liparis tanakae TaxID=230148 RepID=A0A4Z2FEV6_9TELE|nr:hypothetical protein EYF80_050415 [Liparis tanakae]
MMLVSRMPSTFSSSLSTAIRLPNSMSGSCCFICCSSVNIWRRKIRTFLSDAMVAIFFPSKENVRLVGYVLFFANSYKSVSVLYSHCTYLGNLNSFRRPVQYSSMPALSAETMTLYLAFRRIWASGEECILSMTWSGSLPPRPS